jgi:predicted RNA binding protein YcfA (HicA-like mRNA interferase family)
MLQRAGFRFENQIGSHMHLRHPATRRKVTVAIHHKELRRGTLTKIIKDSGLTKEEFLDLL